MIETTELLSLDLRIDARWIIPIEPLAVLHHHSLLIDDGRIVAVTPTDQAHRQFACREHLAFTEHILLPGLVNAHTHAAMTLLRGIADDLPLREWLEQAIWPREGAFISPQFVTDGTLIAAAEMLRGGITCCNDMYFFPGAAAEAFRRTRMRAMLGVPILDFPTPYANDSDEYLHIGLEVRDSWRADERLSFALAPHAPYTVSDATWQKIVTFALELDLPIQTHLQETAAEVAESRDRYGVSPLKRLHALGATGPGFIAVHGVHLSADDMDLLATQSCHVVHCPTSNMKLASGIAPIPGLMQRGVNIALGTDGAASNNRLDILGEARLAALLAKVDSGDAAMLPAAQALHLATLGGAMALGREREIGSLVAGKAADVIAIKVEGPSHLPMYDPMSHLVHVLSRDQVTDVWVAGERLVKDGALTSLDRDELRTKCRYWQERLQ